LEKYEHWKEESRQISPLQVIFLKLKDSRNIEVFRAEEMDSTNNA
jgi:hypothetical protein